MICAVEEIENMAVPIILEYGITRLSVFKSYAKEETDNNSDLDFIMDAYRLIGIILHFAIIHELEKSSNAMMTWLQLMLRQKFF